jgi:hypothetical protein
MLMQLVLLPAQERSAETELMTPVLVPTTLAVPVMLMRIIRKMVATNFVTPQITIKTAMVIQQLAQVIYILG